MSRIYTTYAANLHTSGGQTQTEATAQMSMTLLRRSRPMFRASILSSLREEGAMCTTDAQYATVRAQIARVQASYQN